MSEIPCVGAIVFDADGRILLVRRAHPPSQGLWSIPGGRVDPGEAHEDAVLRELREETHLSAEIDREVGSVRIDAPGGDTYVIRDFLMRTPAPATVTAGDDAAEAAWFGMDELEGLAMSPGLVDALVDWGIVRS